MINREALREYTTGSLWVLPGASALAALLIGFAVSHIEVGPDSVLAPLAFQGTADDARTLLLGITGTCHRHRAGPGPGRGGAAAVLHPVLAAAAAQLPAGPAEPGGAQRVRRDLRLQRGRALHGRRLRRRPHRRLPPARGQRRDRCCCSPAWACSCSSPTTWPHSIQVDAIMQTVAAQHPGGDRGRAAHRRSEIRPRGTGLGRAGPRPGVRRTCRRSPPERCCRGRPTPPALASAAPGRRARRGRDVTGLDLDSSPDDPAPDPAPVRPIRRAAVRIGFERTLEQDAAFGIRQLVDVACKALSPAVNDPYTAVQAVDHLSVIFCALAVRRSATTSPRMRPGRASSSCRPGGSATTSRPCAG